MSGGCSRANVEPRSYRRNASMGRTGSAIMPTAPSFIAIAPDVVVGEGPELEAVEPEVGEFVVFSPLLPLPLALPLALTPDAVDTAIGTGTSEPEADALEAAVEPSTTSCSATKQSPASPVALGSRVAYVHWMLRETALEGSIVASRIMEKWLPS